MDHGRRIYFANTVEAAVGLARKELGEEALLVDVAPAEGEDTRLGLYRVAFEQPQAAQAATAGHEQEPGQSGEPPEQPASEVSAELARLSAAVAQMAASISHLSPVPELARIGAEMAANDVPAGLIQRCLLRVERTLGLRLRHEEASEDEVREGLAVEMCSMMRVDPALGDGFQRPAVVALAGPAGAGKTTTLVKLAMREGVASRKSTLIITTDTHRVAAAEQLRTYAAILGLPFQVAQTPAALVQMLSDRPVKDLVLIDTPGFSAKERDWAEQWAAMLRAPAGIEVQLVLSATTRAADLIDSVRWWELFHPAKLIFTRIDETRSTGGCLAAAIASAKPVSFLGTGQRIPEDLEPAAGASLLGWLYGQRRAAGAAAG